MSSSTGIHALRLIARLCALAAAVLGALTAHAEPPPSHIAVVFTTRNAPYRQAWNGCREYLSSRNIPFTSSEYDLKEQKADEIAARIMQDKADMILALGTLAIKSIRGKVGETPVVYCMVLKPLPSEGEAVTGVSMVLPPAMQLREVRRTLPDVSTLGVIYSPEFSRSCDELANVAEEEGLRLVRRRIASEKEFPDALREMAPKIDCFLMVPDAAIYSDLSVQHVLFDSLKKRYPVIGLSPIYTKAGALISYDCDYADLGRQSGELMARILAGESPREMRPLRPRRIRYSVNLLTAERFGIHFNARLLSEASEVFGGDE